MKIKLVAAIAAAFLCGVLMTGCSQTVESQPAVLQQAEGAQPAPAVAGFFGQDASLLQPGTGDQAAMSYLNPNAQWSQYQKIMLQPVEFWDDPSTKVSQSDQQMLGDYFYNQLKEDLSKNFTLVDQPGPGVLVLRVAIVNATTSTPGLRTVSVIVPQARVLNGIQSLATGSYAFAGSAEAEMKATDGATNQFLAGAIDKRAGGMAISQAAQWQWGDAKSAMDYWAQKITNRLLELQGRVPAGK
ncbi:MAG: DUF3313 domain-containing protein [Candidatus Binatus sp.]